LGAGVGSASHMWSRTLDVARWQFRRTDDERDHAGAVAASGLKTLDELLDLPYLNLQRVSMR
jgi:hypothetical protein